MSHNAPTASPSLSSLGSLARVHDHTRPLPPPRLLPATPPPASPRPRPATSFRSATRPEPISILSTRQMLTASPPNGSSSGEVSLQTPRPDGERAVNEYVDTPLRPKTALDETSAVDGQFQKPSNHQRKGARLQRSNNNVEDSSASDLRRVITKQPQTFTKEPARPNGHHHQQPGNPAGSIFCEHCGKCRCEGCREPKSLPTRWLCNDSCLCSAETALDYASCVCCVKGLFYHCADSAGGSDDAGDSCADAPCSCAGSRKFARWTCLGALALVLPCLLCYWPLKGCVALCESCYARRTMKGCRCDPRNLAISAGETLGGRSTDALVRDSRDPEKRLLDAAGPDL